MMQRRCISQSESEIQRFFVTFLNSRPGGDPAVLCPASGAKEGHHLRLPVKEAEKWSGSQRAARGRSDSVMGPD